MISKISQNILKGLKKSKFLINKFSYNETKLVFDNENKSLIYEHKNGIVKKLKINKIFN